MMQVGGCTVFKMGRHLCGRYRSLPNSLRRIQSRNGLLRDTIFHYLECVVSRAGAPTAELKSYCLNQVKHCKGAHLAGAVSVAWAA
jgi:hypothetical protein